MLSRQLKGFVQAAAELFLQNYQKRPTQKQRPTYVHILLLTWWSRCFCLFFPPLFLFVNKVNSLSRNNANEQKEPFQEVKHAQKSHRFIKAYVYTLYPEKEIGKSQLLQNVTDICRFWYATALFWPVKLTKCENSQQITNLGQNRPKLRVLCAKKYAGLKKVCYRSSGGW